MSIPKVVFFNPFYKEGPLWICIQRLDIFRTFVVDRKVHLGLSQQGASSQKSSFDTVHVNYREENRNGENILLYRNKILYHVQSKTFVVIKKMKRLLCI